MNIFVISLERCQERRQSIEHNLQSLNLPYEIFPAVDGSCLSESDKALVETVDDLYLDLPNGKQILIKDKLINGEIGCALSHLKLYQKIIDMGLNYACILEDDSILNSNIIEAINSVDKIDEPWDVVNFTHHLGVRNSWFNKKYHFGSTPEKKKIQYFRREGLASVLLDARFNACRFVSMTACYVITRQACEKLIKIGYPVRMPSDYLLGYFAYNQLRIFKVFPDANYYVNYNQFNSQIRSSPHKFVRI